MAANTGDKRQIGKSSGSLSTEERDKSRTPQSRGKGGYEQTGNVEGSDVAMPTIPSFPGASPGEAAILAAMQQMETRFMTGLQQTVKTEVKSEITKQITPVKSTVEALVKDMATIKEKVRDLESSSAKKSDGGIPRKDEILDVVVKGFKEKKAKDVLMAEIENMVKTIMGEAHDISINVPDDPCNHGILTFENNTKKLEFYKKVEQKADELDDDISFTNKISWRDRVIEKRMGFIKYHLMKHFNKNISAVKIYWRKRIVEMDGKKVASYDSGTDTWMFYKSAKLVETKVEESMDNWLSKRERTDPPSESE
jgi:ribosomal protein L11